MSLFPEQFLQFRENRLGGGVLPAPRVPGVLASPLVLARLSRVGTPGL